MQLISKFNKIICFLPCVIDTFSKYEWVVPLREKKDTTISNFFQNFLGEPNCKPYKIWVDKGSELYNKSVKLLQDNDIKIYIISISKTVFMEKLSDIVYEYNNKYHSTIKIKPADVNSSECTDVAPENNHEDKIIINWKLGTMQENANTKTFLQRFTF